MRLAVLALATAVAGTYPGALALGASGYHPHSSTHSAATTHSKAPPWVKRDAHGKTARDPRQLDAFKKQHPCPSTEKTYGSCPGYVVDHVVPLKRGGADSPSDMQWQTTQAAKAEDKWERRQRGRKEFPHSIGRNKKPQPRTIGVSC